MADQPQGPWPDVEELTDDQAEQRAGCYSYQHDCKCLICNHCDCGWCPDCSPEVPD